MKKLLTFFIALLLINSVAFAQTTINKSFTHVKSIGIKTITGNCEIRKSNTAAVEIELTHYYHPEDFNPTFEQSDESLEIGEQFRGSANESKNSPKWKLSIPDGLSVTFNTGTGNLTITGVNVDLKSVSGAGSYTFTNVKGSLKSTTGVGNVNISDFNGVAIVSTGTGNISAEKITITESSRFTTGVGRANVVLATTPKFDIAVASGVGDAILDFNGNEIEGEVMMKAQKHEGKMKAPFTFDKTMEMGANNETVIVKTTQRGKGENKISIATGTGDAVLRK